MPSPNYKPASLILLWLWLSGFATALSAQSNPYNLPDLGDSTSSYISLEKEKEVGESWLRLYRSRAPVMQDPLVTLYIEHLVQNLAIHSELKDKRLHILTVDNASMNAFAVPGGIIGIHSGLLLHAQNENELAAVISHELAHLSQRHWARSMEKAQQDSLPTLAALLASLILIATSDSDAGIAALNATQAASLQNRLRYSRQYETEADSLSIMTMLAAGYDPRGVPAMFERMARNTRFMSNRLPEFLLTHPVTEKRIADTRNRVEKLPVKAYPESPDFHLVRSRIRFHHEESPYTAIRYFSSEMEGQSLNPVASRYGYAYALVESRQFDAAEKAIKTLLEQDPGNLYFQYLNCEYLNASGQHQQAQDYLASLAAPGRSLSYPLLYQSSRTLTYLGRFEEAVDVLEKLSRQRPEDTLVWYDLAEVRGLAGQILGVHLARSEYFILNGIFDQARKQLEYAAKLASDDSLYAARIKQRLADIEEIEKLVEKL